VGLCQQHYIEAGIEGMTTSYDVASRERERARALMERCECLRGLLLERTRSALEVGRALESVRDELRSVEALLTRRGKGGLLVGLGLACLALPEPVLSNIAGATLVALGRVLQRRSSSIKDLVEALKEVTWFLLH